MPLRTHQDEEPTLNLTPMIDVLFLLIIFFMAGTKFTDAESRMNLKLPQVAQEGALAPAPEKRVINVYQDGRVSFDREFVTSVELKQRLTALRQKFSGLGVVVRGDADGPFQNVASVLATCREAGITDMGISVRLVENTNGNQRR